MVEGEKKRKKRKRTEGGTEETGFQTERWQQLVGREFGGKNESETRRRGNTPSDTSRSSGGGGNKSEKEGKKVSRKGKWKRNKTTSRTFREGDKRFSYHFTSFFPPPSRLLSAPVPLFLDLEAPLSFSSSSSPTRSSRSFFSKHLASWWGKQEQLHPRSHEHPFYFSSTTIHDPIGGGGEGGTERRAEGNF